MVIGRFFSSALKMPAEMPPATIWYWFCEQRDDVRRGVDVVPLELDAGLFEIAALQRHQLGGI